MGCRREQEQAGKKTAQSADEVAFEALCKHNSSLRPRLRVTTTAKPAEHGNATLWPKNEGILVAPLFGRT